jgi:hypothetical protein
MRVRTAGKDETATPAGLGWLLAAVLALSIGLPLAVGMLLRYTG